MLAPHMPLGPLGPTLGSLLLAGCFVGDAADGLPCEQDDDCGIGVSCQLDPDSSIRCCGGSCLQGAGTSSSTTSSTTDPSTSSTSSSSDGGSSSSESSTGPGPLCGNGDVDEGEACDWAADDACTMDCSYCGNGQLDPGELCDPLAVPERQDCSECEVLTLLDWNQDGSPAQAEAAFDVGEVYGGGGMLLAWRRLASSGAMGSGPYFDDAGGIEIQADDGWPQSWLLSRELVFPDNLPPDAEVVVRVQQQYRFDFLAPEDRYYDHGRVDLIPAGSTDPSGYIALLPAPGDGQEVACGISTPPPGPTDGCFNSPPTQAFCDEGQTEWLAGEQELDTAQIQVPAADVAGQTLQLSFRLRYDCGNVPDKDIAGPDAWQITEVSVVARPAG